MLQTWKSGKQRPDAESPRGDHGPSGGPSLNRKGVIVILETISLNDDMFE